MNWLRKWLFADVIRELERKSEQMEASRRNGEVEDFEHSNDYATGYQDAIGDALSPIRGD
jgi:hypothetical protein